MPSSPRSTIDPPPLAPDFIIAGAQKAGTTSLYNYLAQLPDLFVPTVKEPHFYCGPGDGSFPPWNDERRDDLYRQFVLDPRAYTALYADAGDRPRGDGSTMYIVDAPARGRLIAANPDLKVITVLREPAERAYSAWRMWRRAGLEPLSFSDAIAAEPARRARGEGPARAYIEIGRYATHLDAWDALIRPGNLLVIATSDLNRDTGGTVADVAEFLGIDRRRVGTLDLSKSNLGSETPSSYRAHEFVRHSSLSQAARALLPGPVRRRIGGAIRRANSSAAPNLDPVEADAIRLTLLDETLRLEERTGWDLSSWKPRGSTRS